MLLYALGILSIATFGLSTNIESKLPITTCKRDLNNYSTCLKNFLQEAWPQFVKGLPEFDFPSLDPLLYKYGKIELNSDMMHGEIIMSNFTAIGLSNLRFNDVRTHFLNNVFGLEIDTQVPSLYMEGTIKLNATVDAFRTTGGGQLNGIIEGISGTWDLTGHILNDTWVLERFRNAPSFRKLKLFKSKNKFINIIRVINLYWHEIYPMILPFLINTWEPWLIKFSNKILPKVSFSKLFP